ncbi:hypothetical protein M0R01_01635 [bacterium]|nr:hypothetical protein [bacterium]
MEELFFPDFKVSGLLDLIQLIKACSETSAFLFINCPDSKKTSQKRIYQKENFSSRLPK